MVLLAILTGVLGVLIYFRQVSWFVILTLTSWGLLASTTPLGATPARWLHGLSDKITGLFS
mgnify:CR=1 FL=1